MPAEFKIMWKKLSKISKFSAGLAFQILVILAIVIYKLSISQGGTAVALRLQPVDPRDMLRGDYMTIRYDISGIPSYNFSYSPVRDGDVVYVPLYKSAGVWNAASGISKKKPENGGADYVYIKGVVENGGSEAGAFSGSNVWGGLNGGGTVFLKYNIEQYYVPEGLGGTWVSSRCATWNLDRCFNAGQ